MFERNRQKDLLALPGKTRFIIRKFQVQGTGNSKEEASLYYTPKIPAYGGVGWGIDTSQK
jgi:hypothetical protein